MQELDRFGFDFSDEQREIREMILRFGQDVLLPGAKERDLRHEFPRAEIDALAAMGGMAMKTSVDDDEPGMDSTGYVLAIEALSRFDASVGVVAVAGNLAAAIVAANANEDQRARVLRPLARGEMGAMSFALTEPHCGSNAAAMKTTARLDGDTWVLSGSK